MSRRHPIQAEKFGTVIGIAPGNVAVYSSYYESLEEKEMLDRDQFKNFIDGIYMGYKWQCVEFARRWLYLNKGYIFDDVTMAYEIFELESVREVSRNNALPLHSFLNGSFKKPEAGSLLIWQEGGEFEGTGHVAVITEVLEDRVRIAEQNLEHKLWTAGRDWSRELPLTFSKEDGYVLHCTYDDTKILGWVIQCADSKFAYEKNKISSEDFIIHQHETVFKAGSWLDIKQPAQKLFVEMMSGHRLASKDDDLGKFYCISKVARKELKKASNQLHAMFLRATDFVLHNETLLENFALPQELIPRIKKSWANRKNHNFLARFDFAMSEKGLKVYEYNADSAGCFFECGLVQGLWADHNEVCFGRDAGLGLFDALIESWSNSGIKEKIHIFKDDNLEESYMAEYIRSTIEEANLEAKIINSFDEISWDENHNLIDDDNNKIKWVWKSWAWETAIDQLRIELQEDKEFLRKSSKSKKIRLMDVLLHPDIMVYEPLWTLITSNKALLPVLWQLFPNNPYLLEAHFELTDSLRQKGYVKKPIVGRCGKNITLIAKDQSIIEKTDGQFEDRDLIYQELWTLPKINKYYAQINTFMVDGFENGICVRVSESKIVDSDSDILALRVI